MTLFLFLIGDLLVENRLVRTMWIEVPFLFFSFFGAFHGILKGKRGCLLVLKWWCALLFSTFMMIPGPVDSG
jgi:hypothetical protein